MTTLQHNSEHIHREDGETDQPFKQANLGWEGHVHFPTGVPLWRTSPRELARIENGTRLQSRVRSRSVARVVQSPHSSERNNLKLIDEKIY